MNIKNGYSIIYNSMYEFVNTMKNSISDLTDDERQEQHSLTAKDDWAGGYSFNEAVKLGLDGDSKRAEIIRAKSDKLNLELDITDMTDTTFNFSDEPSGSGLFDVATYLENNPDYWLVESKNKAPLKTLKIHLSLSASFKIEASEYNDKISTLVSMIDKLETLGYSIDLMASIGVSTPTHNQNKYGNESLITFIKVKNSSELYDFDAIAFLSNVAFFRRLGFRSLELAPEKIKTAMTISKIGSYGKPYDEILEDYDLNISFLSINSMDSKNYILETIKELELKYNFNQEIAESINSL